MKKLKPMAKLLVPAAEAFIAATATVSAVELRDEQVDNLVKHSYQYVAMYNVINKNAMVYGSQTETDGWNLCIADTALQELPADSRRTRRRLRGRLLPSTSCFPAPCALSGSIR